MGQDLEVHAGFGVATITPDVGARLSGFGVRTAPSTGIHDPLYARAMTLGNAEDSVVLIVVDVLGVDGATVERIRAGLARTAGMPVERVAVSATHTHGGPVMLAGARLGEVDPATVDRVVDGAVAAARSALESRQPVTLRAGLGREATVAHNRRVPNGPIDDAVGVLRVERADGSVLGLLVNYACHPVTVGPDNLCFTRDYPGVVTDTLEVLYPGATVMFATGCCGQINTGHSAQDSITGTGLELRTFREATRLGRLVAAAAFHESERLADPRAMVSATVPVGTHAVASGEREGRQRRIEAARSEVVLPMAKALAPDPRERERKRSELAELVAEGRPLADRLFLEAWLAWSETADFDTQSVTSEVQCFRVGQLCFALFPGEPFVEFALELRAARPDLILFPIGYANAAPGYLPHRSAFDAGGYEVDTSHLFYGRAAPYLPEVGEVLVGRVADLIASTDPSVSVAGADE